MFERGASQVALMKPSFLGNRRSRKRRFIGRSFHSYCIVAHQGLTHRSSGQSKGCAFCLPLTSNVRPQTSTYRLPMNASAAALIALLLVGCKTTPQAQPIMLDITGSKRPESALFQDHSACSMVFQQARTQAEITNPMPEAGSCRTCGALNAATILMRQQYIDDYANSAYFNCMGARGWRRQQ